LRRSPQRTILAADIKDIESAARAVGQKLQMPVSSSWAATGPATTTAASATIAHIVQRIVASAHSATANTTTRIAVSLRLSTEDVIL
jgi:hypothetical protein